MNRESGVVYPPGDTPLGAIETSAGTGPPARRMLRVAPFRGLRFDQTRIDNLASVTSPPYDVVDDATHARLEVADPHNVVRLILPREDECGPEGPYEYAARTLRKWLADGTLIEDPSEALYAYEQRTQSLVQRGIIGAVGVYDPDDGVILRHEDVMPDAVADRVKLMLATSANLEPILLVYEGGGAANAVLDEVVRRPPMLVTTTPDGVVHRLWPIFAPGEVATLVDLAPQRALIADGHHRYAAYQAVRATLSTGSSHGDTAPWDYGLALLVDTDAFPLTVRAIHRAIAGLALEDAADAAAAVFRVTELGPLDLGGADAVREQLAVLDRAGAAGTAFLLTDGRTVVLLDRPDPASVESATDPSRSWDWRSLDSVVLHELLIDRIRRVEEARISYHHEALPAVAAGQATAGTAVLLNSVHVETVTSLAGRGEMMPRKTTSFGPKPRTGLVLRSLTNI